MSNVYTSSDFKKAIKFLKKKGDLGSGTIFNISDMALSSNTVEFYISNVHIDKVNIAIIEAIKATLQDLITSREYETKAMIEIIKS